MVLPTSSPHRVGFFLARIAFSDDLLDDQKSKFPLFPGGGGPLLQMTSTLYLIILHSCVYFLVVALNGAKCNILLCDTKVHVCWLCSVIHCVVLSVPLGMSLGWDVDFQSNTMISYFYLTPPPFFSWFRKFTFW